MRLRTEIERDFNEAMGAKREEFLEYQKHRILLEVLLDIRDLVKNFLAQKDFK